MPTTAARRRYSPTVDRLTHSRNLALSHAKGVAQSEDFANLAHRRSLGGHRISPCMVTTEDRVRDSIANSESFAPASQDRRLPSERVADFRRNEEGANRSRGHGPHALLRSFLSAIEKGRHVPKGRGHKE